MHSVELRTSRAGPWSSRETFVLMDRNLEIPKPED